MYVILVNDDNTLMATKKQRIMQRSKLVDDLWFLVKPTYNGHDMSLFTASLEYLLPVSKKYRHEILTLSPETYNGYLTYLLPVDTELTAEAGEIALQLTFLLADLDENGKPIQRARKVTGTSINVFPIETWSDIIPDSALSALDQRIIKTDAQIKALADLNSGAVSIVNDLDYDPSKNELQLKSGNDLVGTRIALAGTTDEELKDGIPVIDFDEMDAGTPEDSEDDNVVEF